MAASKVKSKAKSIREIIGQRPAIDVIRDALFQGLVPHPEQVAEDTRLCQDNLMHFVKSAWHIVEPAHAFVDGWHIGLIVEHLMALTRLEIEKLIINVPPRHCKSLLCCVFWFCWTWTNDPTSRWLFTSYAAHLSERDQVKCRSLIKSLWYQARWGHLFRFREDQDTKDKFENDRTGYRIATSVGGVGTGEGADYLVADDIHSVTDRFSEATRRRAVAEWDEKLSTRYNDPEKFRRLIIMQRVHEGDVSGHALAGDRGYQHLCLPGHYEPKRYLLPDQIVTGKEKPRDAIVPTKIQIARPELRDPRKEPGELLWPERFPPHRMKELEAELQAFGVAAQIDQRPSPEKGTIFQSPDFRYFTSYTLDGRLKFQLGESDPKTGSVPKIVDAAECWWFQVIDTAQKITEQSAYTAIGTFAVTPARELLVYHVWRMRLLIPEQYEAIRELRLGMAQFDPETRRWLARGNERPWSVPIAMQALEEKASGIGLIQQARLDGKPFYPLSAIVDKVQRCASVATMLKNGQVWFHEGGRSSWLTPFEDELTVFPAGEYADQVDVFGYAGQLVTGVGAYTAIVQQDLAPVASKEDGALADRLGIGKRRDF